MKILNLTVEQVSGELLINGRHWTDSKAKPEMLEPVIKKLPLDQQWALLAALRRTVSIIEDNYNQARVQVGEIPMSDYERMKRDRSGGQGTAELAALAGKVRSGKAPLSALLGTKR